MPNTPNSQQLSFLSLIEQYKIEIPIIQRDYAQGRENDKTQEIRTIFLDTIIGALTSNAANLELDFVYGDVIDQVFKPLDGQQRLTTLFLLHWYLANKEGFINDKKQVLAKFTYETRTSSRDFCTALVENGIVWKNLTADKGSLSSCIQDQGWFFLSWKKDPTIKSMLVMLDAIHSMLHNEEESLFEQLSKITFHFIALQDFGLSDDLYIKMNARGKPLTDFENFKAKFEQYIAKQGFEKEISPESTFASKMDTAWTDLFWHQRDKETNTIDKQITQFFAAVAIIAYAQNSDIEISPEYQKEITNYLKERDRNREPTPDAVKREAVSRRIQELHGNNNAIRPNDFSTSAKFNYLTQVLNLYASNSIGLDGINFPILKSHLLPTLPSENNKYNYLDIALFYAQSHYLIANKEEAFSEKYYKDWIRVIRNIIWQLQASHIQLIGVIPLIQELGQGCQNIYAFLANEETSIKSNFASEQVKEEIRKAKLIVADDSDSIRELLFDLEDTDFCKGTINWCLECAQTDNNSEEIDKIKLASLKRLIDELFGTNDISNLFRRAMFTIGDGKFYHYYKDSWSRTTRTIRRAIIINRDDLKNNFTSKDNFNNYFSLLINNLIEVESDASFNEKLQLAIDNYEFPEDMPSWKRRIIKEESLLDTHASRHYMGIDNEQICLLFKHYFSPPNRETCFLVENEAIVVE